MPRSSPSLFFAIRPPVRPRAATSCSCRFLALDYFPRLLSPWYMALPEASGRGGLPPCALARQPVESFPWDKLQTVPLLLASRERRAFKGTADSKLRVWIITVTCGNTEWGWTSFPKFPKSFRTHELASMRQKFYIFSPSLYYLIYHIFQTISTIL